MLKFWARISLALDLVLALVVGIFWAGLFLLLALSLAPARFVRALKPRSPHRLLIIGYTALEDADAKGVLDTGPLDWFNPFRSFDHVSVVVVSGKRKQRKFLDETILYVEYPAILRFSWNRYSSRVLGLALSTFRLISKGFTCDVAQINGPNLAAFVGFQVRAITGIPSALFIEAFWEDVLKYQGIPRVVHACVRVWYQICYRTFDSFYGAPSFARDRYEAAGVPSSRIAPYLNNVDPRRVRDLSVEVSPNELLFGIERPVFVTVGRLHSEKRVMEGVRAFCLMASGGGRGTYVVVGDGEQFVEISEFVTRQGFGGRVILLGQVGLREALATMAVSDVFVATYQGNALVEALALGLAVVGFDELPHRVLTEGCPDVRLVDAGDVGALADAMSAAHLPQFSEHNAEWIAKRYSEASRKAYVMAPFATAISVKTR